MRPQQPASAQLQAHAGGGEQPRQRLADARLLVLDEAVDEERRRAARGDAPGRRAGRAGSRRVSGRRAKAGSGRSCATPARSVTSRAARVRPSRFTSGATGAASAGQPAEVADAAREQRARPRARAARPATPP